MNYFLILLNSFPSMFSVVSLSTLFALYFAGHYSVLRLLVSCTWLCCPRGHEFLYPFTFVLEGVEI